MKIKFIFLIGLALLMSCQKEKETYYERPDWLQGPLFEQIKSTGEFTEFVKAAEYTGFDEFLSSRLTFTVFVPTDEAFQAYYTEMGISSVTDLDEKNVLALLQYHTLQNSWDSVKIAGKTSFGWWNDIPDNFRTPCIYTPPIQLENGKYVIYDNTFVHVFSHVFFDKNGYSSYDYESIYPNSVYTGYQVDRASIVQQEVGAENGFYYVIDKVLIPRSTADQVLASKPGFNLFKQLIDRFVTYDLDESSSEENTQYSELYSKSYSLNFDLANEKIPDNAYDGYYHVFNSMFIPSDQTILNYFTTNFPAYATIDNVPNIIIKYFVEAHMVPNKKLFPTTLSKDENETNDFSDAIEFNLEKGISNIYMSSNAIIYEVDSVINTNAFSTASGPIIKNPDYKIFTMMLELSSEIRSFFKTDIQHAVFVLPDNLMTDLGFEYAEGDPVDFTDDKIYRNNSELTVEKIKSFLQNYISITSKNVDGNQEAFIKTKNNKYLKVGSQMVEGIFGQAHIVETYGSKNGNVFEIDTDLSQGTTYTIENYLNEHKADYSEFFALCDSAGMVNEAGEITKLSLFTGITVLLPTNEAIQAIQGSYIPNGANSETFDYRGLIQYQLISERVVFTDDEFPANTYGTDLFINSVRYKLTVGATDGIITITDLKGNQQQISSGSLSNIITSTGIIHVVNQVVQY